MASSPEFEDLEAAYFASIEAGLYSGPPKLSTNLASLLEPAAAYLRNGDFIDIEDIHGNVIRAILTVTPTDYGAHVDLRPYCEMPPVEKQQKPTDRLSLIVDSD